MLTQFFSRAHFLQSIMLNLAGPVCSASYQNLTKFWLALPRDAWGPAFVKLEYDLDVDNLDFFHLDFLHLETLVHQLSNSRGVIYMYFRALHSVTFKRKYLIKKNSIPLNFLLPSRDNFVTSIVF